MRVVSDHLVGEALHAPDFELTHLASQSFNDFRPSVRDRSGQESDALHVGQVFVARLPGPHINIVLFPAEVDVGPTRRVQEWLTES